MIIYPAIDLRDGKAVRLVEGDFALETVFDADPVDAARRWQAAGAEWLHVVDLDGARSGSPANRDAVRTIRRSIDLPLQLGGGIRDQTTADELLQEGIDRIILGTAAAQETALVSTLTDRWHDRIAVGIDARDGKVATDGWLRQTDVVAIELAVELRSMGVHHVILTDIRRDGKLQGPNLDFLRQAQDRLGFGLIASGGIATLHDVRSVAQIGASGAIIGRAIYDGRIDLGDAIAAARAPVSTL